MIPDHIIAAMFAAINALLNLVPDITLDAPEAVPNNIGHMFVNVMDLFPIRLILQLWGARFAIEIALQGFEFVVFVYHQFWGSN